MVVGVELRSDWWGSVVLPLSENIMVPARKTAEGTRSMLLLDQGRKVGMSLGCPV